MSVGGITPSQTAGPYFSMRLAGSGENVLVAGPVDGERIRIDGVLVDGAGRHVEDGLVEMWQANGRGRYRHPEDDLDVSPDDAFSGFGRAKTSFTDGSFSFETIKPGPVPDPEGELQAPHLNVIIQGRGILRPYFTRIYFSDEANEHDLVLGMIPDDRRHTLIATKVETTADPTVYEITFRLQGPDETVFLSF